MFLVWEPDARDMQQNLKLRSRAADAVPAKAPSPIDRDVARLLSQQVAEDHRLAFARSFALATMEGYWAAHAPESNSRSRAHDFERLPLTAEAAAAAEDLASRMALLDPAKAAYLIGTIYATALPDAYRASHGIFYTPRRLSSNC